VVPASAYSEDDLLPISALQHLAFCERQWGLIHLEGAWAENRLTTQGRQLHDRVDRDQTESRGDLRIARGLRLHSFRLGLVGRADVVEFHRLAGDASGRRAPPDRPANGVRQEGVRGWWRPVPVEYKRGRPKKDHCDRVQLCAQALCLEEMLDVNIDRGTLFYGKPRRRYDVTLDDALRRETEALALRLHKLTGDQRTPAAAYATKCKRCSLYDLCLPKSAGSGQSASAYLRRTLDQIARAVEEA
jgi:CRISPR-associated exonuclease Cas4